MNRRMEPRALSAVADRVTSDGSPVETGARVRAAAGGAPEIRGQDIMQDHEKRADLSGIATDGTGEKGSFARQPQLDRPTQTRIGDQLRSMYAELMDQPVPDRFRSLLDQLDDPARKAKPDREDGR